MTPADDITPEEMQAIQQRCDAATPGPWDNAIEIVPEGYALRAQGDPGASLLSVDQDGMGIFDRKDDATFTAHARTDLPRALAALRRRDADFTKVLAERDRAEAAADLRREKRDAAKALLARAATLLADPPIGGMNPHNDEWLRMSYALLAEIEAEYGW